GQARVPVLHKIPVSFRPEYSPDLTIPLADIPRLTVRFLGFRPGFAYLDGWPEKWRMPRRPTSRNRVPAGSFAVAGAFAGFYAVESPGGWNLLGRTAAPLWDPRRDPPNLLAPGDEIEIVPTMDVVDVPVIEEPPPPLPWDIELLSPGQLTKIVGAPDVKRLEHGLPTGGPFDPELAAATNRAVGNDDDAPLFECVLVGPRIRFRHDACFALDGEAHRVRAGEEINVGRIPFRAYVAIGNKLRTKNQELRTDPTVIRVLRGPHDSSFADSEWEVTPQLDRVGIRLRPLGAVAPTIPADLPSIGVQFGSVQWHPDGTLVLMGPDHPVTGGYLQPVTVISSERWKLAHLAPGQRVTLRTV
ncbi:MAG TPA: carboxyltransferase domain-containing protein, partial [Thermoanaerobaculia bacterium]|nr:carboxyltransferase domain-containing protein [Thermoanaerobaculia bacterium]